GPFALGFDVTDATYDEAAVELRVTVDPSGPSLESFVAAHGGSGSVSMELVKRFFRVSTDGVPDVLPETAWVRILFQAATADPDGAPGAIVQDWTADVSRFNLLSAGEVDFFRFEVEFELDATENGLFDPVPPEISLEFLRMPFAF
ncbi:MAG: hypothetical protein O7B99_07100, partial [Planctomycetota bacterium]|nr:hypothetical protein [Planctomycetota bacterium]